MSKDAAISRLKRQIADLEAKLADLRDKLARLVSGVTIAQAAAEDPVLALWKAALAKSRERSSKQQCRIAWSRVPKAERPDLETAVAALKAWNRCEEWTKDACMFAPGLHRWIGNRGWEDVPEVRDPVAKYRAPAKAAPVADPADTATEDDIRAIFGTFKPRCTPPAPSVQGHGNPGQISHFSAEPGTVGPESPRNAGPPGDHENP